MKTLTHKRGFTRTPKSLVSGFTLIELLVSVAIFSLVMVMALGALLTLSTADRRAQALKSTMDNLNFALDSMSRNIRTGYGYNCSTVNGGNCLWPNGGNTFYFTSNTGVPTAYQLENTTTDPSNAAAVCGQTGTIGCLVRATFVGGAWTAWSAITSPDVILTSTSPLFYLTGSAAGSLDNQQPLVLLTISGYAQISTTQQAQFHLQTTIAQRIYDQ